MNNQIEQFYDWLAADYDAVYSDWEASVHRQASALDRLIRDHLGPGPHRILDCTCGIGTQALGLAALGYSVVGSDVSEKAVTRARTEAEARGLNARFVVADLRSLSIAQDPLFDVVLSADNALPHLADEADLRLGLTRMVDQLRHGGLLMASIRDYDAILEQRPAATLTGVSGKEGDRRITFQLWDWSTDGQTYDMELFIVREIAAGQWQAESRRARYRAVTRAEVSRMLEEVGLDAVEWAMPAASGFFQPIVTARRPC